MEGHLGCGACENPQNGFSGQPDLFFTCDNLRAPVYPAVGDFRINLDQTADAVRVVLQFTDSIGTLRGQTSVAIVAPQSARLQS